MKVKFRIQYNTVWGQGLTLISRDVKYPMQWEDGGYWSVFLAFGAQVIFFAPVAGQFLILGAPDAFFAPVGLGISGVYVQCGLILHIFSRNSRIVFP